MSKPRKPEVSRNERALTHVRLKEWLDYDPQSGLFTWRKPRGRAPAGSVIKSLNEGGYIQIQLFGYRYLGHRLAWFYVNGKWPSKGIDHRDLDEANNRIANLREANQSQNNANQGLRKNKGTSLKGIYFAKDKRYPNCKPRWIAQIKVRRASLYIGSFSTPEAAHVAYMEAAQKHFGEFARAA